ncbi:MAG: biopolymer transporter ExbD [Ignavibacteria bacterium]|nr:biopolymer transporter ExbD [Ignavibacteria bacterium]
MPKIKKARIAVRIDMTPMVDVILLLLTFFMMTTQFRPQAEVDVTLPSSHSEFKLPESDVMMVTVSRDGRIFLGLDSQHLRAQLFGEQNKLRTEIEVTKEQLGELLVQARVANPKLRTVIKGDKIAPFGPVEDLMEILQKRRITRFNLVTELEKTQEKTQL